MRRRYHNSPRRRDDDPLDRIDDVLDSLVENLMRQQRTNYDKVLSGARLLTAGEWERLKREVEGK